MTNIILPKLKFLSDVSVEEAILNRKSIRKYENKSISLQSLDQILWAAQGITHNSMRSVSSAGALYPVDIYVVINNVDELSPGIYCYKPKDHSLKIIKKGIFNKNLYEVAGEQDVILNGAINIVIIGIYDRTTGKYGKREIKYVCIESGAVVQNIYLQAVSLNLGTVCIGSFDNTKINEILNVNVNIRPLSIMPVGPIV